MKSNVFWLIKLSVFQFKPALKVRISLILSCVYDSMLLLRPMCNFRDGRVIQTVLLNLPLFYQYTF